MCEFGYARLLFLKVGIAISQLESRGDDFQLSLASVLAGLGLLLLKDGFHGLRFAVGVQRRREDGCREKDRCEMRHGVIVQYAGDKGNTLRLN